MQRRFKISLLVNGGLLAALVYQLSHNREARLPVYSQLPTENPAAAVPVEAPAPTPAPAAGIAEQHSLSWAADVEASDYPTYISNLRKIGCPKQTIRDIISADVDTFYAPLRKPIEQKLATSSFLSRPKAEAELQQLQTREAAQIAGLLGDAPANANLADDSTGSRASRRHPPQTVSMPLLFQQVDVSSLKLNPGQVQAIEDLRQRFVEEIGGLNQDPGDPAYKARWMKAQPEYDSLMQGMIGANAYDSYQLAVRLQAEPGQ